MKRANLKSSASIRWLNLDAWRFVFGARYVDNSESGHALLPRGSIVYAFDKTESMKLLYAEGFNSPTFAQSAAVDIQGMPLGRSIGAENIQSWELAYTKTSGQLHYVMNLFHIEAQDLIRLTENSTEAVERNGAELELQQRTEQTQLFAGISYIHEGNGKGDDIDANYASRWLLKLGGNYELNAHRFGASLRSAGPREGTDSYHLLNLHYRYVFDKNFQVFSTLTNVFDDKIEHPDLVNADRIVIEGSDGASFFVGFRYHQKP